jgi:sialate O-acetylesterase
MTPTKRRAWWVLGAALAAAAGLCARAEVRLPALFTDHMVLQQAMPVPLWGWADDGEAVIVRFRGWTASTVSRGGKWMVRLPKQTAGGPFSLIVEGKNRIELTDVLVGEVWICSGQSNMEWPLQASENAAAAIAQASHPQLRLFTVPKLRSVVPVDDVKAQWQTCTPDTAKGFTAVGYFFGQELQRARKVPVGLIHTSWGGSPAEVWMSEDALAANPVYERDIVATFPAAWRAFQADVAKWEQEAADAQRQGKQPSRGRPWMVWRPSELYNGMIHPILPYAARGAIWYQGESNAGRAKQYRTLFPDMIRNWRHGWGQADFTFLAVQLAPWDRNQKRSLEQITAAPVESDWAELREAQVLATRVLPKVGLAVITDVGDKDDIHPVKKREVGVRLARAARSIANREPIVWSGPVYHGHRVRGDSVILSFNHVGHGLVSRGGDTLTGFAICGADRKFVWADARIEGRKVVVSSSQVAKPVAVRYGWADYPVVNLWNKDGLPASPFRTDDFPMVSK